MIKIQTVIRGASIFNYHTFSMMIGGRGFATLTLHVQENDMLQNLWSVYLAYIVTLFALYFKQWS